VNGRAQVVKFLRRKWARELDCRLKKDLWAFTDNRVAVRFEYEFHDTTGQRHRAHGNESWGFDDYGHMRRRFASINDPPITEVSESFAGSGRVDVTPPVFASAPPPSRLSWLDGGWRGESAISVPSMH